MRLLICCFLLLPQLVGAQQVKVTFKVHTFPAYHAADAGVYIAGNFNNWNPKNESFRLHNKALTITVPKGLLEFKATRGGWDKVEVGKDGISIDNRRIQVNKDSVILFSVLHWADHFPAMQKKKTASKNVQVIDTAFYMPQLGRHRRIWVYTPPGYNASADKYPVLYMHDGQNVFDEATAFSGEWGIDEALDTLGLQMRKCIVVAIDNGNDRRMNEYAPFDMEKFGRGEGDQYLDFLVKTLLPYIENNYRVLSGKAHRFIAGSSMGGLISFYALLKYPDVFGGAGVFSPAFWITPQIKEKVQERAHAVNSKIYFYAGAEESESMVLDMQAIVSQMQHHSKAQMHTVVNEKGKHAEAAWRQEFPNFYKWIMQ